MIVDDSLTVRRITSRLLTREGFDVVSAKDGVDALELLQTEAPDVILLDIEMPRMDGFEFTKKIKADAKHAQIPIVMITSRTAEKHRNLAKELGVELYLGKPFQEDELLDASARDAGAHALAAHAAPAERPRRRPAQPRNCRPRRSQAGIICPKYPYGGANAWRITPPATSARSRWSGRAARARPRSPRRCCSRPARSRRRGRSSAGRRSSDFDPLEKTWQHSLRASVAASRHARHPDPRHRHAGLPRLHRTGDRRARRGGDGRGRGERAVGHRDDRVADDGLGGEAQALPPRHRQQDRRGERRSAESSRADPGDVRRANACRSTCPRAAASASSTASSTPRATPISRRSKQAHGALVDQVVEVDEELMSRYLEQGEIAPEELHAPFEKALREGHLVPVCFVSARTGAGVAGAPRRAGEARAESGRRQSAAVLQRRGRRGGGVPLGAGSEEARARARVQGRHGSVRRQARRLSRPPGNGDQGHAALRRRRTQAVQGRAPVHAAGRQERRSRERGARATSRRSRRSTRSSSTACCTTRTTRITSTCARSSSRRRCRAWRSRRASAATSSGSPKCCTG